MGIFFIVLARTLMLLFQDQDCRAIREGSRSVYGSHFVHFEVAKCIIAAKPFTGYGLDNYDLYS